MTAPGIPRAPGAAEQPRQAVWTALAAVGLTATIGQLLLLRELVAVLYGNELVISLILGVWLAATAAGAALAGRRPPPGAVGGPRPRRAGLRGQSSFPAALALAALLLPAEIALVRAGRGLLGATPGALLPPEAMVGLIAAGLGPLAALLGYQFALGARLAGSRAYAAESAGALAGGALFSLVLVRWLDACQVALLVGALNIATLARWNAPARRGASALLLLAVGLLAAAWPLGAWLQGATLRWQYPGLLYARDSAYGRMVVTAGGEQRAFFENGLLFFETQGTAAEEIAHLPLLAHADPRHVLLIGGGVRGTLAEILRHPSVERVDYVELDPLILDAARQALPPAQAAALDDPRATLLQQDGRTYVARLGAQGSGHAGALDAMILDLPGPLSGQLNRFYTLEFFRQARAVLAPGGVLALSLPWQENYAEPAQQRLAASVQRSLAEVFPHVMLLPGERLLLLASDEPLPADRATWQERLAARGIAGRWVVPSYLDYILTTERAAQAARLLAAADARENRDLAPAATLYGQMAWLSRLYPAAGRLDAHPAQLIWLAVPLGALVLAGRVWAGRVWGVLAAVGLVGLAQMAIQVVLLLAFQVTHGTVYGHVGLIVTAFMAGLAGGSAAAAGRAPRAMLLWVVGGLSLYAAGLALAVAAAPPAWVFALLALAAGALGGAAFPLAVERLAALGHDGGRAAGRLYAADLAGACLGALLSSVVLVPVLGLPGTCLAMGLVGVAAVVIVG